ncbi:hypothetical protein [Fibrobacter sp.]|uniref:hypothetical protein n=1 Tax=Fibrobacter sp. TaxID=35828 RepID=UPI0025BCFD3B|nr:hypothetical protein [Fibrobacter sp.]MBR3072156.1 hypothetical protein [Fibrobacter sp.]
MNINSLPKHYRSRLLRETNCIHKEPIPSQHLAKLLNACPKYSRVLSSIPVILSFRYS